MTLGGLPRVNVNACVAFEDKESVTFAVKLNVPLVVGAPEITPLVASVNPVGNVPEMLIQL